MLETCRTGYGSWRWARDDIRVVVIDATASSTLDSTAGVAIFSARDELQEAGIAFWVANVKEDTWQRVVTGAGGQGGTIPRRFDSLDEAVDWFEQHGNG